MKGVIACIEFAEVMILLAYELPNFNLYSASCLL